jgi:ribosomal protein L11 methyltransferase
VANILADVIMPLSGMLKDNMRKNSLFISSGIIDMKKDEVEQTLIKNGFEILEIIQMGDWFSFVAKK